MSGAVVASTRLADGCWLVREQPDAPARVPTLVEVVRNALRTRHYSRRTEKAYVAWIRRYILFHGKRHPREMSAPEVSRFLTALAVEGKVTASTQNQALSALLFLYRNVLGVELRGSTISCARAARDAFRWSSRVKR